jgi:hypothetical protein
MANKYFTQLTQLAAGSVSAGDALAIEDISAGETKYSTASDFATYVSSTLAGASGGWDAVADTWTYLGTTTGLGTVSIPAGGTLIYGKGDKIKFTQGGTQLYFYATSVGGTTLVLTGGSDYTLGTAAISSIYYSKAENPLGFPDLFNWTVTHGGFSVNPTYVAKFSVTGRRCFINYDPATGTGNSDTYTITLPIVAATGTSWQSATGAIYDNGVNVAAGFVQILTGGTTARVFKSAAAAWTAAAGKSAAVQMVYGI